MEELNIEHSGILGMKWGRKNGPPYPLGASDHSTAEAKGGTSGWTKDAKADAPKVSKFATVFKNKKSSGSSEGEETKKQTRAERKAEKKSEKIKAKTRELQDEADYYKALKNNAEAKAAWNNLNNQGKEVVAKQNKVSVSSMLKQGLAEGSKRVVSNAIEKVGTKAVDKMLEDKKSPEQKLYEKTEKQAKYYQNKKTVADTMDYLSNRERNQETIRKTEDKQATNDLWQQQIKEKARSIMYDQLTKAEADSSMSTDQLLKIVANGMGTTK